MSEQEQEPQSQGQPQQQEPRKRLISSEPVLINMIANRKLMLIRRGILRERVLVFSAEVGRTLRDFGFWVSMVASSLGGSIMGFLSTTLRGK